MGTEEIISFPTRTYTDNVFCGISASCGVQKDLKLLRLEASKDLWTERPTFYPRIDECKAHSSFMDCRRGSIVGKGRTFSLLCITWNHTTGGVYQMAVASVSVFTHVGVISLALAAEVSLLP